MRSRQGYPSLSVERLGVDLEQDSLKLATSLLKQNHTDFCFIHDIQTAIENRDASANSATPVDEKSDEVNEKWQDVVARINVLVLLGQRVFGCLRESTSQRNAFLLTVYRGLALALCSRQRAVRCAALRCLRHYTRTGGDVRLLLTNRLDLVITRCFDLSFDLEMVARTHSDHTSSASDGDKPGGAVREYPRFPPGTGEACKRRGLANLRGNSTALERNAYSILNPPSYSSAVSPSSERMLVLRYSYQLLRLAPRFFPPSLVQALASSLTSHSFNGVGVSVEWLADAGFKEVRSSSAASTAAKRDPYTKAYLFLLVEFVLSNYVHAGSPSLSSKNPSPHQQALESAVRCIKQSLSCAAGETSCGYPSLLLENLMLTLIHISNDSHGRRLIGPTAFQKFITPFMVEFPVTNVPRSPFDANPNFLTSSNESLVLLLKSWSGLFYFLNDDRECLATLTRSLSINCSRLRIRVLSLLYNVFPGLPAPHPSKSESVEDVLRHFSDALATSLPLPPSPLTRRTISLVTNDCIPPIPCLDGDFVVEEGFRIFNRRALVAGGTEMFDAYSALLLTALINVGLLEALILAVNDQQSYVSAAAGVLLGFLVYKAHTLFPPDAPSIKRVAHAKLVTTSSLHSCAALDFIERVHAVLQARDLQSPFVCIRAPLHSPFLEQLANQRVPSVSCGPSSVPTTKPSSVKHNDSAANVASSTKKPSIIISSVDEFLEKIFVPSRVLSVNFVSSKTMTSVDGLEGLGLNDQADVQPYAWNWDLLAIWGRSIGHRSSNVLISWSHVTRQTFLGRLVDFVSPDLEVLSLPFSIAYPSATQKTSGIVPSLFLPSPSVVADGNFPLSPVYTRLLRHHQMISGGVNGRVLWMPSFAWTSRHWLHAWAAATLYSGLLPHLCLYPHDSQPGILVRRFLTSVLCCLSASLDFEELGEGYLKSTQTPTCLHLMFSSNNLKESCAPLLFFLIGRIAACEAGASLLQMIGYPELLFRLTLGIRSNTFTEDYRAVDVQKTLNRHRLLCSKLVIGSLDFTRPGLGQRLVSAAVIKGSNSVRLFAVKFIRLLLRMNIPEIHVWCVSLFVTASVDCHPAVVQAAIGALEEVCLTPNCLHSLLEHLNQMEQLVGVPNPIDAKVGHHSSSMCPISRFPLRLLAPDVGLLGHRVLACLLASSSIFKRLSLRSANAGYQLVSGTEEGLVQWMLSLWVKVHNREYADSLEQRFNASYRRLSSYQLRKNGASNISPAENPPLTCPGCGCRIQFQPTSAPDIPLERRQFRENIDDDDDPDLIMRQSNVTFPPLFESKNSESTDTDDDQSFVELSLTSMRLFGDNACCLVPPHLYSALASHEAGFRLLCRSGGLSEMSGRLHEQANRPPNNLHPRDDSDIKSAIWALSHVLVTRLGVGWSLAASVVSDLLRLCSECDSLSVRGTAWLGLCYISSSPFGAGLVTEITSSSWLVTQTDRQLHLWPLLQRRTLSLSQQDPIGSCKQDGVDCAWVSSADTITSLKPAALFHLPHSPSPISTTDASPIRKFSAPMLPQNEHQLLHIAFEGNPENFKNSAVSLLNCESSSGLVGNRTAVPLSTAEATDSSQRNGSAVTANSLQRNSQLPRWLLPRSRVNNAGGGGGGGRSIFANFNPRKAVASFKQRRFGQQQTCIKSSSSASVPGCKDIPNGIYSQSNWTSQAHMRPVVSDCALQQSLSFDGISSNIHLQCSMEERNRPNLFRSDSFYKSYRLYTEDLRFQGLVLPLDVRLLAGNLSGEEKCADLGTLQLNASCLLDCGNDEKENRVELGKFALSSSDVTLSPDCMSSAVLMSSSGVHHRCTPYLEDSQGILNDSCPLGCASEACRLSSHSCLKSGDMEIDTWRGDLMDTVESFLNSVLAAKNEASLIDLFGRARGYAAGAVNACLVTQITCALSCYHYSRPARTIIQSFLSEFPVSEWLIDATTALNNWTASREPLNDAS